MRRLAKNKFLPVLPWPAFITLPEHATTYNVVTGSAPTPPPESVTASLNGTNLVMMGTNGVPGWPYFVLASSNLALRPASWTRLATNQFDVNGAFSFTNLFPAGNGSQFYRL